MRTGTSTPARCARRTHQRLHHLSHRSYDGHGKRGSTFSFKMSFFSGELSWPQPTVAFTTARAEWTSLRSTPAGAGSPAGRGRVVHFVAHDIVMPHRVGRPRLKDGESAVVCLFLLVFYGLPERINVLCVTFTLLYLCTTSQPSGFREEFHMVTGVTSLTHHSRPLCC